MPRTQTRFLSRRLKLSARSGLLIGTAGLAIAMTSSPAQAACTTDGADTLCLGVTEGYTASEWGQTITVAAGATLAADPVSGNSLTFLEAGTLNADGAILSQSGLGVDLAGMGGFYRIRIGAAGSLAGTTAIAARADDEYRYVELENDGTIVGSGGTAVALSNGEHEIVNRGVIRGAISVIADEESQTRIENAGQIDGNVTLSGETDDVFYQRLGGTVTGNVDLGEGDDAFWREVNASGTAARPGGTLEGGAGRDTFGLRVKTSGTIQLDPALPAGFERYGVDLCGCDTNVTLAAGNYEGGLLASGRGTLTNLASFTAAGDGPVLEVMGGRSDDEGGEGGEGDSYGGELHFINRATIRGTGTSEETTLVTVGTSGNGSARLTNEGAINLDGTFMTGLDVFGGAYSGGGEDSAVFNNRGTVTANAQNSGAVAVNLVGNMLNSGTIEATGDNVTAVLATTSYITNAAGGVIRSSGQAVDLQLFSQMTNHGLVESTGGAAVLLNYGASFINEAGGTVRGNGTAVYRGPGDAILRDQVANKGTIVGDVRLEGDGEDTVWLAEGSQVQGNVTTGDGDDRIILDINRAGNEGNVDTTGIVTGSLTAGPGDDTLWLRAGADVTKNVITAANGFEAIVYEAAGSDTDLVLRGPLDSAGNPDTLGGTLALAGEGTITVDMGINNGGTDTQSLRVESGSSAQWFGGRDESGPALILRGGINAGSADVNVDAFWARAVTLAANTGDISFTGGTGLQTGWGADVLLDNGSRIRVVGSSIDYNAVALSARGSNVVNRGSIYEDSSSSPTAQNIATGVLLNGGSLHNQRTDSAVGRIDVLGTGIEVGGDGGDIVNDGEIISHHGDAIAINGYDRSRVVNGARGLIRGHADGTILGDAGVAISGNSGSETIVNAGAIEGHVVLGEGSDAYIATGGRITGNLDLGGGDDNLLARGGAAVDVTGTVAGGAGYDAYGRSFEANATFDLTANVIQAGFEAHAAEALGVTTEVTLASAVQQTAGARLFGDGKVINTANFNVTGATDAWAAIEVAQLSDDLPSLAFENRGRIETDMTAVGSYGGLQDFNNSGTIISAGAALSVDYAGLDAFVFRNSGAMSATGDVTVLLDTDGFSETGESLNFGNNGQISNSGEYGYGIYAESEYGLARVVNAASVSATGANGTGAYFRADRLDFTNGGTIESSGSRGTALALSSGGGILTGEEDCPPEGPVQGVLAGSFTNTGIVRANGGGTISDETGYDLASAVAVQVGGDHGIMRLTNAAGGLIEATGTASTAVVATGAGTGYGGVDVDAAIRLFELDNSGTIRGGADTIVEDGYHANTGGDTDLDIESDMRPVRRAIAGAIQTANTTDRIRNLAGGQIIGNVSLGTGDDYFENLGSLNGDLRLGAGDDSFVYAASSTFTGTAYGDAGNDTLLVDLSGTGSVNFDQFRGFETLRQRGSGSIAIRGTTDLETLNIAGSSVSVAAGTRFDTQGATALQGSDEAETLVVSGTIGGTVNLAGGADVATLNAGGLIEGDLLLGGGNDRLNYAGGSVTGVVDGGEGSDTIAFRLAADANGIPTVTNFESLDVEGNARLTLAATQNFETITLRGGADLTLNAGSGNHTIGTIVGDDSAQDVIINTQLTGGVSLGGGDDALTLALAGSLSGALDGGAGSDTLNLNLTGASSINGGVSFETINVTGASPLTLGATIAAGQTLNFDGSDNELIIAGGVILGRAVGGAGRDRLVFASSTEETRTLTTANVFGFEDIVSSGAGTSVVDGDASYQTLTINGGDLTVAANTDLIVGQATFDDGDSVLTLEADATLTGPVDGGLGTDRLVLNQSANQVRQIGSLNYTGFEQLEAGGPGNLRIDANASFATVDLVGARMTIDAGATLTVPMLQGNSDTNTLDVRGTLAGGVDLGGGNDRLIIAQTNSVTGERNGGEGTDTLEFRTAGTYEAPVAWNGTGFTSFENLAVSQGVLSYTGTAGSWQNVAITGGRLIGQAGSVMAADTINVGQGAIFGSAGTVNADIIVAGTLSPGASPGTMTVNGDVTFQTGSNLLLEMTPTGRDLLSISGTLNVQQGAAIDITGALSAVPGGAVDLVVAQGGITGGFSTINKSSTVFGFVATRGNRIQIVGEFSNNDGFGTNAQASIDYANEVLGSGQLVQAFTAALPALVGSTGTSNEAAFAQLTPEAYASAGQLAVDNGLGLADSVRSLRFTAPTQAGFYGFAQGLQQWNKLGRGVTSGAASAKSNSTGLLGGIGYGSENGTRIGAFIGTLDSKQNLSGLGASTDADGIIGGVFADAQLGGFGIHALLAYDGSEAETRRALPAGEAVRTGYDLGGLVADFSADYAFDLGAFQLAPRVGLTYVAGRRDGVSEDGNAFALAVAGEKRNAWFGDAGFTLSMDAGAAFRPYAEVGIRHQLSGRDADATGIFTGTSAAGPITVSGAERSETVARLGAGIGLDLTSRIRLNVGYSGEFGDEARHNLNGGIAIAF